MVVLLALGLAVAGASRALPRWTAERPGTPRLASLPMSHGGWRAAELPLDVSFLGSVRLSEWVHRRYVRDGEPVEVFLGANDRLHWGSLLSPKTAILRSGVRVESHGRTRLAALDRPVESLVLEARGGRRWLAYHWYEGVASWPEELLRDVLALDRGPLRRRHRARVVRLATRIAPGASGAEAAARLERFAGDYREPLARLLGHGGTRP